MKPASPVAFRDFAQQVSVESAFTVLAVAKQLKAAGKRVIELEIGDSPFPSTASAKQAGIDAIASTYRELRIWDVNGGAGKDRGEASIKFFEEAGLLKKDAVSFNQSFETGPLDRVLKKIGRR